MIDNLDSIYIQGLVAFAIVVLILGLRYPDRAVFCEYPKDVAFISGWPLIGSIPNIIRNKHRLHDYLLEKFTELNALTFVRSSIGLPLTYLTINPRNIEYIFKDNFGNYVKGPQLNDATIDLLGHGIFNANGEQWKYQRKTASRIFNVKNFRDHFTEVFANNITIMTEFVLDNAVKNHQAIDFHELMYKFTLDSFTFLGFGIQLNTLQNENKIPFATSFDEYQLKLFRRFINPLWKITETLTSIIQPWNKTTAYHLKTIDSFANEVIEQRRIKVASGKTYHQDLLSHFMNTKNEKGIPLNNKELRDVVLNLIVAGRDTTAQALSWMFYMLLTHPHVETELLKEIDEKFIDDDLITKPVELYEVVKTMTYAHAVLYEVLRLFPSVPNNQKYALNDDVLPDGTVIKKGNYVFVCTWVQGRSEIVWGKDAKEFKPERWITMDGILRRESQGQWPVFHAGPRVCLGQHLATLEAIIAMIFLIKRYKLTLMPKQNITYELSLTLPMKEGMKVFVEHR